MFRIAVLGILLIITNLTLADKALIISDIHFNPFYNCSKIPLHCSKLNELVKEPIEKWQFDETVPSSYKEETNNFMLVNALRSFKAQIKPDENMNIFITGDMLAHGFGTKFKYYKLLAGQSQYSDFTLKTVLYVLLQIHNTFPKSKIYFVLGNNDSDAGNYKLPSHIWLNKLSIGLAKYLPNLSESSFITQFSVGGYYSVELNNKIQIIGMNDILFSSNANSEAHEKAAKAELAWLNQQLAVNAKAGKKVIILQHIPFGVDVFNSISNNETTMLLDPTIQIQYLKALMLYNKSIASIYAGHLHSEYLQEVNSIPVVGTIALNRYYGNNAGVKLIDYNANTGAVNEFTTYKLSHNLSRDSYNPVWNQLYSYPSSYNTKDSLSTFIIKFPAQSSTIAAKLYQTNYDENSINYPQPIHKAKFWKNYFCFMNFVDKTKYEECLD